MPVGWLLFAGVLIASLPGWAGSRPNACPESPTQARPFWDGRSSAFSAIGWFNCTIQNDGEFQQDEGRLQSSDFYGCFEFADGFLEDAKYVKWNFQNPGKDAEQLPKNYCSSCSSALCCSIAKNSPVLIHVLSL